jgi:hypothetical protein
MSRNEFDAPIVVMGSDLAYLQREFGLDSVMEAVEESQLLYDDILFQQISQYFLLTLGEQKVFKQAIVGDSPDNWEEELPSNDE